MALADFNLLLVSGPIREKLWIAHLALCAALALCFLLTLWLASPGAVERASWAFPLRGKWLRRLLRGVTVAAALFCLYLILTSGLGFFVLFPFLAR